jgi:5'-hydroxyaverantin dehydrogenase
MEGKNCFLTGGASDMRRATAKLWARAGAHVTIADIHHDGFDIAECLRKEGYQATFVHCDVTNHQSQVNAFGTGILATWTKTLDVVVMFAGLGAFGGRLSDQIKAITPSIDNEPPFVVASKVVEVSLLGTYYTPYLALHHLRLNGPLRRDKALIFLSSTTADMDYAPHPLYGASKFTTRGLWRNIRDDTRLLGVRCVLLAPFYVDKGWWQVWNNQWVVLAIQQKEEFNR